jgi:hypothetical protein
LDRLFAIAIGKPRETGENTEFNAKEIPMNLCPK